MTLDVLRQLEAFAVEVIPAHQLSARYSPVLILAPLKTSYAVVLDRAGDTIQSLEYLTNAVQIGREVLRSQKTESSIQSFVSSGLVNVCRSCAKTKDAEGVLRILQKIEGLAGEFAHRAPGMPNFDQYRVLREIALAHTRRGDTE